MAHATDNVLVPRCSGVMDVDEVMRDLAEQQYGILGRGQLIEMGLSPKAIRHRLDRGMIERARPSTYRLCGVASSWEQELMAACLWAGPSAAASHRSAAALLRLPTFREGTIDVSTPRTVTARDICVYNTSTLHPSDIEPIAGIPTTSIPRTLIDLAATAPRRLVEDAVDDVVRRRLVSIPTLHSIVEKSRHHHRRGVVALRSILDHTNIRAGHTASVFESRVLRTLSKARLPLPIPQYEVRHEGRLVARVDFAYPKARLIIEAESYRWHSGQRAFERDVHGYEQLRALGWKIIRVTWHQLKHCSYEFTERVRAFLLPTLI